MFFATYVLTQKGPLAKVWLAAHWDKKLTSKDVKVIDLKDSVVHVIQPTVPIALRTSGELMLGIVRIYAQKVAHLLKDATEATSVLLKPRNVQLVKVPAGGIIADGKGGVKEVDKPTTGVAITLDVTVGRVGAEQLADADFGEVADLLNNNNNKKKNQQQQQAAAAAAAGGGGNDSWWFATEASQTVEEIQMQDRTEAAMAQFKAQLDQSSAGNSKKGTSSTGTGASSVEQQRAQAAAAGGAGGQAGELDIGFIPPTGAEEDEFLRNANLGIDQVLDGAAQMPFADDILQQQGDEQQQQQQQQNQQQGKAGQRKLRMVIVMDANTSLKPQELKKITDNRDDILNQDRRHGPLDDGEIQDRKILNDQAIVTDCSPLSCYFTNDVLRAAFHHAVNAVATERMAEIERLRGAAGFATKEGRMSVKNNKKNQQDQQQAGGDENPIPGQNNLDDFNFAMPDLNTTNQQHEDEEEQGAARKQGKTRRGRNEQGESETEQDGFSESTRQALAMLREKLLSVGAKQTTFMAMMEGKHRKDACRTFVDLLHLASLQYVSVAQRSDFSSIVVTRGPKFNEKKD